jgi:hypothetical protein
VTVAHAALPVAVALLVFAAAARAALWLPVRDEPTRRAARVYAEPLVVWCLIATAVNAAAALAAVETSLGALAPAVLIAVAAVSLTQLGERDRPAAPEPAPAPEPAHSEMPPPRSTLWSGY